MDSDFALWYAHYPRREGRGQAIKAYRAARKKVDASVLLDAAREFYKAKGATQRQFIPLPASWLNGERWADEKPEVVGERELDLAMPWLETHGITQTTARCILGLMDGRGYKPGETMIRLAIASRGGQLDLLELLRVRADRFTGDPTRYDGSVDYEWAMETAYQAQSWKVAR